MPTSLSHQKRYQNARLAFQQGDIIKAEQELQRLVEDFPSIDEYRIAYANFLSAQGQAEQAAQLFRRSTPEDAYNRGHYLSHAGLAQQAIAQFEQSIHLGLSNREDALNRMAGIHREYLHNDDGAEVLYLQALEEAPSFSQARVNLANLYEDRGLREKAQQQLHHIAKDDALFPLAITRLAAMERSQDMLARLEHCLTQSHPPQDQLCDLMYELGHQNEAQGKYDRAWQAFQAANQINASLNPVYQPTHWQQLFDQATQSHRRAPEIQFTTHTPRMLFICGMFRSGSTLLEQMLASHSLCAAGGELDFFPKLAAKAPGLSETYDQYIHRINKLGTIDQWVSDKRPDNLWHVDLIKQVFPEALIVITQRDLADNALSIYQQRLGPSLDYACHPLHIKEYALRCQHLAQHWQNSYPDDVVTIQYESLIADPEKALTPLMTKMGLVWEAECLTFHQLKNTVKTASVWQVRQPLHSQSIARSRHFPEFLTMLGLDR